MHDSAVAGCLASLLLGCCLLTGYSFAEAIAAASLCAPLAWRSRLPLPALGAVALGSVAYLALVRAAPVYVVPLAFALYAAAESGSRRRTLALGALLVPAVLLIAFCFSPDSGSGLDQSLELAFQLGFALAVGEAVRSGRELLVALRQRNETETRRRVNEERVRIARDLHDIVSHSLATISTQASVGAYLGARSPAQGSQALADIRDVSRAALDDLRHALGDLRGEEGEAPRRPAPSLRDLPSMVERARDAGLSVDLRIDGSPTSLPSGLQLAAFRIVQECLTNAMRHAGGARVTVRVAIGETEVKVDVADDGNGEATRLSREGFGSGLIGMRERASALGGDLEAGAASDGGFRVRATLPLTLTR